MQVLQSWGPRMGRCFLLLSVVVLSVGAASAGPLVGVGGDPPIGPFPAEDNMISIGDLTNPVPIVPVPEGDPWIKDLVMNRDGQGWSSSGPNSMVKVKEFIELQPDSGTPDQLPISDWHEMIDPTVGDGANFKWAGGTITTPTGSYPGTVSADGTSIDFVFPTLPLPAMIMIDKDLMWNGDTITPGPSGTNDYHVRIIEQPSVPEPSSFVLAALGLLGCAGFIRRRAK